MRSLFLTVKLSAFFLIMLIFFKQNERITQKNLNYYAICVNKSALFNAYLFIFSILFLLFSTFLLLFTNFY